MIDRGLDSILAWLEEAPEGTLLPAHTIAARLRAVGLEPASPGQSIQPPASWRERIWSVPDQTRLGVAELSEAIGRPASWIYRHTSPKSGYTLIPHRKLEGELVFVASEIRGWIDAAEERVVRPSTPVLEIDRRRRA